MAKINLMTQADYAKHRGCSGVSVFKAVKAGRISLIEGKIDAAVADIQWATNTRARAPNRKSNAVPAQMPADESDSTDDYMASRSRREAAEASIAEMKESEMRGKYLQKTEVDAAVFEIARAMRDGLTNCARRIAADVAALDTAEDCAAVIDREHRALLESMAHSITTRLGARTADDAAHALS